jgi:excisionase family DNA binding protein
MIEYLDMTRAAEYISVSRSYLYKLIKRNKINEPVRIGGHAMFAKEYLDEWKRFSDI